MITNFNKFDKIPDVNSVSNDFWKMVTVTNWKSVIKIKKNYLLPNVERNLVMRKSKYRVYSKYSFEEVNKFYDVYYVIYDQLYDWFKPIVQNDNIKFPISDDSYSDLLSSIIGKGKKFVKECVLDTNLFVEMARKRDYVENFVYILQVNENEYNEIKEEFDPMLRDMKKYNL